MDIKHITSDSIRTLLGLTDKKTKLINALADLENEIANALKGAATVAVDAAEAVTPFKPAKNRQKAGRHGGLKARILDLLEAAGDEGLRVRDIAAKLGRNAANISVWFSTTGKDITTKIEPGRFAKKSPSKSAKPGKPGKPGKPVKKSKPAKAGKSGKSAPKA
jgi:hypothetical protein